MTNDKSQLNSKIKILKPRPQAGRSLKNRLIYRLAWCLFAAVLILASPLQFALAQENTDSDADGLSDYLEINIYRTDPKRADTDGDGYIDGVEIENSYDPNKPYDDKIAKVIGVSLKDQTLTYSVGPYILKTIFISSGLSSTPTPPGEYAVEKKLPLVTYRGRNYYYPNTKWNMLFKSGSKGGYYIHGAYWHNNFGKPMSHGCINVSYTEMQPLYEWADVGTRLIIE